MIRDYHTVWFGAINIPRSGSNQSKKSPLKLGGEPMHHSNSQSNSSYNFHSHSHTHSPPRPHQRIFVLSILAIVLTIATIFIEVFDLELCEFCGFNDVFNNLDNDFEWEKSGLNHNEYDLCDALSSPVVDTIGASPDTSSPALDVCPTGVGLTRFGDLEYYLIGVLSAPATVAIENEIKTRFDSGCTLYMGISIHTTYSTSN